MHGRLVPALAGALLLVLATSNARAQALSPGSAVTFDFEVVSVKENPGPNYKFQGLMDQPDGLDGIGTLKGFVADAFGIRREFVSCKLPLCDKPTFEIRAKINEADQARFKQLSWQEKARLLQPVLKDRFGLEVHTETRPTNVYDLVVAKGGSKLKRPPANPASDKSGIRGAEGSMWIMSNQLRGFAINLDGFVPVLSQFVADAIGRPVVDKTGLTGLYDIELKWTDTLHNKPDAGDTPIDPGDINPGIFAALPEQLGLELKPAREPEPTLVIDQAHTPTPD